MLDGSLLKEKIHLNDFFCIMQIYLSTTQRNKIEIFVSGMHFDNCFWVNWGQGFKKLHHLYSLRSTFFATACFLFITINYAKHYTGLPLKKLFKQLLSNFWALILNLCTYLCQKFKFLNYIFIYTIYAYTTNLKIVEIILSKALSKGSISM